MNVETILTIALGVVFVAIVAVIWIKTPPSKRGKGDGGSGFFFGGSGDGGGG